MTGTPEPASEASRDPHDASTRVLRNAAWLAGGGFLAAPLALLVSAIAAHVLGPTDFAWIYLATTFAAFGFLVVEWGQSAALTSTISRDRGRALDWLASSLGLRALLLGPVALALLGLGLGLHYPAVFLAALGCAVLAATFTTASNACQDLFRGHERADLGAASYLAGQVLAVLLVAPALLLGAGLFGYLLAQVAAAALGALALLWFAGRLGAGRLAPDRARMGQLFLAGRPFLIFNVVLALQGNLDALFLSRLAPAEVVGWSAVATKLAGVLVFPATAVIGSLYPTLCRIGPDDPEQSARAVRAALRLVLVCAAPLALGCALFPGLGVRIYGGAAFRPAESNLHILAAFVFLVYVTMPLGSTLVALGRQRAWTWAQLGCVLVSVVLDPVLIPWFQARTGNGGLGVCVAGVVAETLMLAAAIRLMPLRLLDGGLRRTAVRVGLAACALLLVARTTDGFNPWLAAALSGAGYLAVLLASGELPWPRLPGLPGARRR